MENSVLHICDECVKEHNLKAEKCYATIRPCSCCVLFDNDGEYKQTRLVRNTLRRIEMNKVRREFGYVELGEPINKECK